MREIKFRGKQIDNGEWVYGSLIGSDVIVGDIIEFTEEYFNCEYWWRVKPETVGQYTGLKDSKRTEEYPEGQEIYEGDIIKCLNVNGEDIKTKRVVVFQKGYFLGLYIDESRNQYEEFLRNKDLTAGWYDDIPVLNAGLEDSLIIGNIYENPELINQLKK